jgi:hypothetical protein
MKNWQQAKEAFIKDHLSKSLEQPERRLNALKAIEKIFQGKFPELLNDKNVFDNFKKMYFLKLYECLKGRSLSSAEKSVINGLYKFSV